MPHLHAIADTPNGARVTVHRLHMVTLEQTRVLLTLNHYADADQEIPTWQDVYPMPLDAFQMSAYPDCVWDWIASPSGLFPGGAVVTDPTSLEDARKIRNHEIERMRDGHLFGGFEFQPYGRIQTDQRSLDNIKGVVMAAIIAKDAGEVYSDELKIFENTLVEVDGPLVIQVGLMLLAFVKGVYARSWQLKDLVAAAQTIEELEAIELDGWPPATNNPGGQT